MESICVHITSIELYHPWSESVYWAHCEVGLSFSRLWRATITKNIMAVLDTSVLWKIWIFVICSKLSCFLFLSIVCFGILCVELTIQEFPSTASLKLLPCCCDSNRYEMIRAQSHVSRCMHTALINSFLGIKWWHRLENLFCYCPPRVSSKQLFPFLLCPSFEINLYAQLNGA